MNRLFTFALAAMITFSAAVFAADAPVDAKKPEHKFDSENQKLSYALGMNVGRALKNVGIPLDVEAFSAAIKDVVTEKETKLSIDQAITAQMEFEQSLQKKQLAELEAKATQNAKAAEAFLAANSKKEGIKTTKSGLQYEVVREGNGPSPKETDVVSVHYRGTFLDGKQFDSSYERGKPTSFPLTEMIKGWTEGVMMMKVGAKHILYIPPQLAFGERGAGGVIEPNTLLVFEVELLKIEEPVKE